MLTLSYISQLCMVYCFLCCKHPSLGFWGKGKKKKKNCSSVFTLTSPTITLNGVDFSIILVSISFCFMIIRPGVTEFPRRRKYLPQETSSFFPTFTGNFRRELLVKKHYNHYNYNDYHICNCTSKRE